ncbi:MAG: hypothetical protein ACPL4K_02915 [Candidatus Margulisiibacteriota bacterium]
MAAQILIIKQGAIGDVLRTTSLLGPTSAAEIELYGLGEKLTSSLVCQTCYKKGCQIVPNCHVAQT